MRVPLDSGNETDVEPEAEEECLWELNPLSVNKLDVNSTANDVGKWYINEQLDLVYFSVFASDFVPSDTSTDIGDDPWSAIDTLTSLHVLVRSSLTVYQSIRDAQGSFFEVPVRHKGQKSILSEESSPNQRYAKTQKARLNSLSSLIMSQMYSG